MNNIIIVDTYMDIVSRILGINKKSECKREFLPKKEFRLFYFSPLIPLDPLWSIAAGPRYAKEYVRRNDNPRPPVIPQG